MVWFQARELNKRAISSRLATPEPLSSAPGERLRPSSQSIARVS